VAQGIRSTRREIQVNPVGVGVEVRDGVGETAETDWQPIAMRPERAVCTQQGECEQTGAEMYW
jgi:hypothetical protein